MKMDEGEGYSEQQLQSYSRDNDDGGSHGNTNNRKRPRHNDEAGGSRRQRGNEPLLKCLVPIYVAGALIGKKGALLADLKAQHGGHIRISAGKELYPGTDERVIVLTGTTDEILGLNRHIMEKVEDPGRDTTMRQIQIDEGRTRKHKIVLTNLAAGLLIGKGGLTIKNIQTNTRAKISIAPMNEGPVQGERLLTITGTIEDRAEACQKVIEVIAKDPSNMGNFSLTYPSLSEGNQFQSQFPRGGDNNNSRHPMNDIAPLPPMERQVPFNNRANDTMDRTSLERVLMDTIAEKLSTYTNTMNNVGLPLAPRNDRDEPPPAGRRQLKARVEMTVEVPNAMVGGVLGKSGSIIKELVRSSGGAKMNFADKTDDATTTHRNLTIVGDVDQAMKAYNLVNDRVDELMREQQPPQPRGGAHHDRGAQRFGGGGARDDRDGGRFRGRSPPRRDNITERRSRWDDNKESALQGFLSSY